MDSTVAERVCLLQERIAQRIGLSRFKTWFGDSTTLRLEDDRLLVLVATPFAEKWIADNFLSEMRSAALDVLGEHARVEVRLAPRDEQAARHPGSLTRAAPHVAHAHLHAHPHAHAHPQAHAPAARPASAAVALRGELDSYIVGPPNRLAYAAALEIVRKPRGAVQPLVVHGGCGLGKTHLLHGICNGVRREHPTLEWRYVSGEEFTNEFVQSVRGGRVDAFRARFRRVDLLVIDDVHFLANKKATQEEFLHTFNAIDSCGKTVVLSSDRHPRAIVNMAEPLVDRLISGVVVQVEPPDLATRREILTRRAGELQSRLSQEVLEYVARRVERNVRELEGAFYKLAALASLMRDPLSVDAARAALDEHLPRSRRAPEAADIERIVGTWFGVSRDVLQSDSRDRTVTLARAVAMFLARRHTGLSFPELGRAMGRKNHSTVLMAAKRIEAHLANDSDVTWKTPAGMRTDALKRILAELEDRIRAELSA